VKFLSSLSPSDLAVQVALVRVPGMQGSLRLRHTFIQFEEQEDHRPIDARSFRTEPGTRSGRGQEYMDTFRSEAAYVEGLSEKLSSTWSASVDLASKGNADEDDISRLAEDSAPADQAVMRFPSECGPCWRAPATEMPAALVPATLPARSDRDAGIQGCLRLRHTFIDLEEERTGKSLDARSFQTEPGVRVTRGEEHMDAFGREMAYVEGLSERLCSTWSSDMDPASKVNHDHDSMSTVSEDSALADQAVVSLPQDCSNVCQPPPSGHPTMLAPAAIPMSGGGVATGVQGSLRWHHTFIDFKEESEQELVDARAFQTEPGIRHGRGEERFDAFGGEAAYVEGLSEKLSFMREARGDLPCKDSSEQDRAPAPSEDDPCDALGSSVTAEAAAATHAGQRPARGLSWSEFKQFLQGKASGGRPLRPQPHQQRDLGTIEEVPPGVAAGAAACNPAIAAALPLPMSWGTSGGHDDQVQRRTGAEVASSCNALPHSAAPPLQACLPVALVRSQAPCESFVHAAVSQGLTPAAPRSQPPAAPPRLPPQLPPSPSVAPTAPWGLAAGAAEQNPGSLGHPHLCLRPCLFFAAGECSSGDSCHYCHLSHERRPAHLDKKHREMLRDMPLQTCAWLMLPVLRRKVEDFPASPAGALAFLDQLAAGCGLAVPGYVAEQERALPGLKRQHRALVTAMKSMSLRLLAVAVGHALGQHRPQFDDAMVQLLGHLRQAVAAGAPPCGGAAPPAQPWSPPPPDSSSCLPPSAVCQVAGIVPAGVVRRH